MRIFLIAYAATAATFLMLDFAWLSATVNSVYRPRLGDLLLDKPDLAPAALFYVIYVAGIVIFAVLPGLRAGEWTRAMGLGAALGFLAYATYDLTNLATLRGWSVTVTVLDLAWGSFVTAAAASAGMLAASWLTRAS